MATKLYYHDATSSVSGTLPSTNQGSNAITVSQDAQTVNRTMNTTIGTTQTSKAVVTNDNTSLQTLYFTRFVSETLQNDTTISANTWSYNFACRISNVSNNFPCSGANQPVHVLVYVWRPSNGTKVGNIIEGNSDNNFSEPDAANSTKAKHGTFSGGSISALAGDVIIQDIVFRVTQANNFSRTDTFYYDGTTENTTENAVVTSQASYIETPQDLVFGTPVSSIDMTVTTVIPVHPKPIKVV